MASRYQKVTDVEKALQYYEAGLLYGAWPSPDFMGDEYVPYNSIRWRYVNGVDMVKKRVMDGNVYVLVEEDEEQPLG